MAKITTVGGLVSAFRGIKACLEDSHYNLSKVGTFDRGRVSVINSRIAEIRDYLGCQQGVLKTNDTVDAVTESKEVHDALGGVLAVMVDRVRNSKAMHNNLVLFFEQVIKPLNDMEFEYKEPSTSVAATSAAGQSGGQKR